MYREYWKLDRNPFGNTPDPDFFYVSSAHKNALNWLLYGVRERKGGVVLTGAVGCGKTVVSRKLIQELSSEQYAIAAIVNPALSPIELLREILYQLGADQVPRSKFDLLRELNEHLITEHESGRHTVIIIDEAQTIRGWTSLEELRLLLNFQQNDSYLLTLVLIGQPEWADRLAEVPQLEQRIAVRYDLPPLDAEETGRYIEHRLRMAGSTSQLFHADAIEAVFKATRGVPRRINNLCDRCLLLGYQAGSREIDPSLVRHLAA